jgi:hypothetical protein
MVGTGLLCLSLYVWHAKHTAFPIIDLALLRIPTFHAAVVGGLLFRIGIGATPFLLPLMLQLGFGLSPFLSGLLTFSSAIGATTMRLSAPPIVRYFGHRNILIVNSVLSAGSLMACAWFRPSTPHLLIIAVLLTGGFFRSLQFSCVNTLAYCDVPAGLMSRATPFYSMGQQLSLSLGVGTGALLLHLTLVMHGQATLAAGDFAPAFIGVALISLASMLLFVRLAPEAGEAVSGRHPTIAGP